MPRSFTGPASMPTGLNARQMALLTTLAAIPARQRAGKAPGGPIPIALIDSFDWRTLNALFDRGLLQMHERGVIVTGQRKGA